MNLVDRVKKICLTPQSEWSVIAGESTSTQALMTEYVLPLAGAAAVAGFVGNSLVGRGFFLVGSFRVPIVTGITLAVFSVVAAVIGCIVISMIINALAPQFGAQPSSEQALKLAVYSFTPAWVAGLFQILPALAILTLLGSLYGLYLLFLGLPRLMQCPPDKAVGYTVVVVLCALVVTIVLGAIGGTIVGAGMVGAGLFG
jgi:hypothetical protein